jgi:AraC-like DNA-binding protein
MSPQHSAMVHAHKYHSDTIDFNSGTALAHEVFPAGMVWGNIFADEKTMMHGIKYSKKKLQKNPHFNIDGHRHELIPISALVEECIEQAEKNQTKHNICSRKQLESCLYNLISARFNDNQYEQEFISGDKFRMQMLKKITKLSLANNNQALSLDAICRTINMKRRTVQKYFHEIYGMGPTEYIRIRRLNEARNDLMNGAACVSDVALQWGFTHFGRFSGAYKKHFGESPRTTIKTAQAD